MMVEPLAWNGDKEIALPCQICGSATKQVLSKERNVSCGDYFVGHRIYEEDLGKIELNECAVCGFASFDYLHAWSPERFQSEIYNDQYHLCDPPFRDDRPRRLSAWLSDFLSPLDLIDYGGGEGRLSQLLTERGFHAHSYDPFYGDPTRPADRGDVVTAFEVVEHVPRQRELFDNMKALCRPNGVIIFSTLLKPKHLTDDWWYASARNGHVSFHTEESLALLIRDLELVCLSLSKEVHVAAFDETCLAVARNWPACQINDTPQWHFTSAWERMTRTAG